jgi:hypothetical protein
MVRLYGKNIANAIEKCPISYGSFRANGGERLQKITFLKTATIAKSI